jgi:hypothetical protein
VDPASLLIAIAAMATVTIAPMATHMVIRGLRLRRVALLGLAEQLGGEHLPGGVSGPGAVRLHRPEGTVLLRRSEPTGPDAAWPLVIELRLHTPLPDLTVRPGGQYYGVVGLLEGQDIQLGHPVLDRDFRIQGPEVDAVRFMIRGDVVPCIFALTRAGSWGALKIEVAPLEEREGSTLRVYRSAWVEQVDSIRGQVDAACALAQAMMDRWIAPWTGPAERWELQLEQQRSGPLHSLAGTVDGLPLRVQQLVDRGRKTTRIRISMSTLGGLRMAHRDHAREVGWLPLAAPVGNPVLDMLVAVKSYEPELVRALLADEDLTTELLEVLHGHPGSELNQQGLSLVLPGHLHADLEGPIEQALALARSLRRRLAAIGGGAPQGVG